MLKQTSYNYIGRVYSLETYSVTRQNTKNLHLLGLKLFSDQVDDQIGVHHRFPQLVLMVYAVYWLIKKKLKISFNVLTVAYHPI